MINLLLISINKNHHKISFQWSNNFKWLNNLELQIYYNYLNLSITIFFSTILNKLMSYLGFSKKRA